MEILGIGPQELVFIVIIALIILGPKDMQKAGKTIGKWLRNIVTSDGWKVFQQTSHELRRLPTRLMREANDEFNQIGNELNNASNPTVGRSNNPNNPPRSQPIPPDNKIASRTVVSAPALCERILARRRPTYVSLGAWDRSEFPFGPPDGSLLHYVYCRSKYPTQPADLASMPAKFSEDGFSGYSDHSLGIDTCLTAVARGARYVEKHFTLDKTSQVIRDHVLSASPQEFRQLVDLGRPMARFVALCGAAASRG